ncbi:MAG: hypothetical protein CVV18_01975, partial [Gammaproteobacteria bacterium HGW-Gammaproteobacteria-8]
IFTIDFPDAEFEQVIQRFVRAGKAMQGDGWWNPATMDAGKLRRQLLREVMTARFKRIPNPSARLT